MSYDSKLCDVVVDPATRLNRISSSDTPLLLNQDRDRAHEGACDGQQAPIDEPLSA